MKIPKRDRLIEDLKLLACGANGGACELSEDWPYIQTILYPSQFEAFRLAVRDIYAPDATPYADMRGPFTFSSIDLWATFETLADAIIAERKRVNAIEKQKGGE